MVGFALIVIIVAVILLVFLRFSITQSTDEDLVESYEVRGFIQSILQYTTEYDSETISIRKLIKKCNNEDEGCEILESELSGIMEEGWKVEEGSVVKGYNLEIVEKDKEILKIEKGVETENYKISEQDLLKIKIYY